MQEDAIRPSLPPEYDLSMTELERTESCLSYKHQALKKKKSAMTKSGTATPVYYYQLSVQSPRVDMNYVFTQ